MNIIITGASTGIGWDLVNVLSNQGHKIFAGVRKQDDFENIQSLGRSNIHPLYIDVTKEDQVENAFKSIQKILEGEYIDVLINNAGIVVSGPLESIEMEQVKQQFDVNVFGLVRMIQACLTDLKFSKGRIINIGSASGYVSWPFSSVYCSSKHAVTGLGKALRLELQHLNIQLTTIAPGAVRTPLWDKALIDFDSLIENNPDYSRPLQGIRKMIGKGIKSAVEANDVTKVVQKAIHSAKMKEVYVVGPNGKLQYILSRLLLFGLFEKFQLFLIRRMTPNQ